PSTASRSASSRWPSAPPSWPSAPSSAPSGRLRPPASRPPRASAADHKAAHSWTRGSGQFPVPSANLGKPMTPAPVTVTTLVFAALCIACDVRRRRIPNLLSGLGMAVGIVLNGLYFGSDGLLGSMSGLLVAVVVLLPPFAMGGLGGGDVKMMGAI